jgi:putative peptidoglycan lipid II flippase
LALVPSLIRSGAHLRFEFRPRDPALRRIISLSGWTFGIIATNQAAVFVVLILAYHLSDGNGAVSAYTYAYAFFQFPFAIAATSIVNVATPDLARFFTVGDFAGMARRFGIALRQMLAVILPATVGYLLLAGPAVTLALAHGAEQRASAATTGSALAFLAIGLPGYCVFFLVIRTMQAMQDTRSAFICYALENAVNIGVAVLLYQRLGVKGLALSFSIAYALGAIVALVLLRWRLGSLGGVAVVRWTVRAALLSLAMALVVALVSTATGSGTGLGGWIRLLVAIGAGVIVYFAGAGIAGTLAASREARRARAVPRRMGGAANDYRRRH